jgi:hypothetical protein
MTEALMTDIIQTEVIEGELLGDAALSAEEAELLNQLEGTILEGVHAYLESCFALRTIREQRLYRQGFGSFEQYCRERWSFSKTHANRMIDHCQVVENLTPTGVIPEKERHTRPLAKLPPEKQREAWQLVINLGSGIDSRRVQEAADAVMADEQSPDGEVGSAHPTGKALDNPAAHDQHLTPPPIKTLLYGFFECGIDVDPCCNEGEPNIEARQHFRMADDGLSQRWSGTVFANPPYSGKHGSRLEDWAIKIRQEFELKVTTEAIVLVPNYSSEGWWQHLNIYPHCTIRGRVTFSDAGGRPQDSAARFASALFYLGPRYARFKQFFGTLGRIWKPELED